MKYKTFFKKKYQSSDQINDHLRVKGDRLYYKNINLLSLVKKYGDPLEVAYTEMISQRIRELQAHFKTAITKHQYPGNYLYAYAQKANYYSEVITTALDDSDALETTSSYDLDIVEYLYQEGIITKDTPIICNGFKYDRYFEKVIKMRKKGLRIIPILESEEEVDLFLDSGVEFQVGMRLNIDDNLLYEFKQGDRLGTSVESRFGIPFPRMKKCAQRIQDSDNLTFTIFHFHFGGTITSLSNYIHLVRKIFENYYCPLKQKYQTLEYLDIGGGLPVQYDMSFSFDYGAYADKLVKALLQLSKKNSITPPHIIGENGRYTVNDHSFFCFKIAIKKKAKEKNTFWYLIQGSLMNFLPDSWALGQQFLILPLNGWNREYHKVKLGGITCDPDDTYYKHEKDNIIYLPDVGEKEELYIGVFGIGAYQEMISGVGGVHHCLLPEGNELIIYKQDGKMKYDKITKKQEAKKVLQILDYHGHHNLKRYLNRCS